MVMDKSRSLPRSCAGAVGAVGACAAASTAVPHGCQPEPCTDPWSPRRKMCRVTKAFPNPCRPFAADTEAEGKTVVRTLIPPGASLPISMPLATVPSRAVRGGCTKCTAQGTEWSKASHALLTGRQRAPLSISSPYSQYT